MDLPDFFIIAAVIAIIRWVIRSLKEPGIEAPVADGKTQPPPTMKPGQKGLELKSRATGSQKPGATARRSGAAPRHVDIPPAWNVLLDVPEGASRSEIQAAAKRRIAQAVSNGDHAATATITRAVAAGLKHRMLRTADALPRGRRDP
jgi:hypothetical protein